MCDISLLMVGEAEIFGFCKRNQDHKTFKAVYILLSQLFLENYLFVESNNKLEAGALWE